MPKKRQKNKFANGFNHKLKPLKPLDLGKVKTIDSLVKEMGHTSFGARSLGEAADVLYEMVTDKACFKVLTLSGAMTVAKMGLIVAEMIDSGMVDAVVSTGAILTHGFVEGAGKVHFKADPKLSDTELYTAGYDRVYDTLELEKNLNDVGEIVHRVLQGVDRDKILTSYYINELLGKYLQKASKGRNILKSAYNKKVPIYVPAFSDSELGLDVAIFNRKARIEKQKTFTFDPFLDLEHFAGLVEKKKRLGIFTIGGGVPRNWAQQICPYFEIIGNRLNKKMPLKRYTYGVRICPEPAHWGGLSGCTYEEGISWGKFTPPSEGGRWAEVLCDATIAWPIVVKAVLERME